MLEKREDVGYFRFLYMWMSPIVSNRLNPASASFSASFTLVAVLHVYSSFSLNVISCVYNIVVSIFLCPSRCLTNRMSFVLSYSMVA